MSLTDVPAAPPGALPSRGAPTLATRRDPAATPFHSSRFGRAWATVTTEAVANYRLLQWPMTDRTHQLPCYLVDSSPLWNALEVDAGLSTLDSANQSAVWQGSSVTYARTLYGEYGGLPGAPDVVLGEAVDRGIALAREWDTAALVVTNLTAQDAMAWGSVREPDAAVTLYWAHRMHVPSDPDAFITQSATATERKTRRELRRQWNRGREAGLTLRVLRGDDLLPLVPALAQQAAITSQRHGPALYGPDILRAAMAAPGALALVAMKEGHIAGAFICFEHARTLYLWTAALDLDSRAGLHTYAWLMWEAVRYAVTTGADAIDAGRGNYRYKSRLGLSRAPLMCLVYLTRDDEGLQQRLRRMHTGLDTHAHAAWTGNTDPPSPASGHHAIPAGPTSAAVP